MCEGKYIPHAMGPDGEFVPMEDRADLTVRSFWVSGIASPFRTIGRAAEEVARAFRSMNPDEVQAATNTVGGEPYGMTGDSPTQSVVKDKRQPYSEPAGVRFVTIGADVQKESIYYVARGWGVNAESWLLDYGQVFGNTEYDDVWIALASIIARPQCGYVPRLSLVDSGFRAAEVYNFARRTPNVSPSKGRDTMDRPHYDSLVDESPRGKAMRSGVRLWHVNSDYYKQWVYARIRWPHGQPGDWHIPDTVSDDYCAQVVNEVRGVIKGKVVWQTTGNKRNHFLDCEVNATCAAHICNVMALSARVPEKKPQENEAPATQRRMAPSPLGRRTL